MSYSDLSGTIIPANGYGFGLKAGFSAGYKLSSKLYANASINFHISDIPLKDDKGNSIRLDEGHFGTPGLGYIYYDRYLSAQPSGIEGSIGS